MHHAIENKSRIKCGNKWKKKKLEKFNLTQALVIGSWERGSPFATHICHSTRSSPIIISVTFQTMNKGPVFVYVELIESREEAE